MQKGVVPAGSFCKWFEAPIKLTVKASQREYNILWWEQENRTPENQVLILAWPVICCVALDRSLNSVPQFPPLLKGNIDGIPAEWRELNSAWKMLWETQMTGPV